MTDLQEMTAILDALGAEFDMWKRTYTTMTPREWEEGGMPEETAERVRFGLTSAHGVAFYFDQSGSYLGCFNVGEDGPCWQEREPAEAETEEAKTLRKTLAYVELSIRSGDPYVAYINTVALVKVVRRAGSLDDPDGRSWEEHFRTAEGLKEEGAAPLLGCGCRTGCCPHSCSVHWTPEGERRT
jgi:hypothetical protein